MKRVMVSIFVWTVATALTVFHHLVLLVSVALFPFDRDRRRLHEHCYWWSDAIIAMNPFWKVRVSGLENIDQDRTYVIVANHQSLADVIVLYQTRMQFKWVAKESLFSVPFLGWSLSLCRHIKIRRGQLSSIKQVYLGASRWLRKGMSVLMFPEGTRSEDGKMGEFQNGAFKLAIREKVPVLPILIEGTYNAVPKGSWLFTPKTISGIRVLTAIETGDLSAADYGSLKDKVRSMLVSASSL